MVVGPTRSLLCPARGPLCAVQVETLSAPPTPSRYTSFPCPWPTRSGREPSFWTRTQSMKSRWHYFFRHCQYPHLHWRASCTFEPLHRTTPVLGPRSAWESFRPLPLCLHTSRRLSLVHFNGCKGCRSCSRVSLPGDVSVTCLEGSRSRRCGGEVDEGPWVHRLSCSCSRRLERGETTFWLVTTDRFYCRRLRRKRLLDRSLSLGRLCVCVKGHKLSNRFTFSRLETPNLQEP